MLKKLLIIASVLLFSGCASNPMAVSASQKIQPPENDKAQVVFMRSSFLGGAINASLYDVTDGTIKFIGIVSNGTKIDYNTTPGKHTFMVVSEAADFMESNLKQGKNYFSVITPRMGLWKARFSLWPFKDDPKAEHRVGTSEFKDLVKNTTLVKNTEKSLSWYEHNKKSVKEKYSEYWPVWEKKSADDISKRTLSVNDGM
ncbi:hypothetical protein [Gallaecimonas sp. GXIMD1310]|uniref:hypothetical protein n=1 Tax=Gallaecimonas sp. GXIMD1310 TaxID=3131926 RepID=UPI0032441EA5